MRAYTKRFLFHLLITVAIALGVIVVGTEWVLYVWGIDGFVWLRERIFYILFTALVAALGVANELTFRATTKGIDRTGLE